MASFKFVVKGEEKVFTDKSIAIKVASKFAVADNKILEVFEEKEGGLWETCATLYPSGEVRYPVNIGSFAEKMPIRRKH